MECGGQPGLRIKGCDHLVEIGGPVIIVHDVLLAGPDDLDRIVCKLPEARGLLDRIDSQPTAETASNQVRMHDHFFDRQTDDFGSDEAGDLGHLRADPDVAAVRLHVDRRVDRLERGMCEIGKLIGRLDTHAGG
ncbi:hypothetical protein D3C71_1218670 [compost metagenome]